MWFIIFQMKLPTQKEESFAFGSTGTAQAALEF
jgi:hypothetical protein